MPLPVHYGPFQYRPSSVNSQTLEGRIIPRAQCARSQQATPHWGPDHKPNVKNVTELRCIETTTRHDVYICDCVTSALVIPAQCTLLA